MEASIFQVAEKLHLTVFVMVLLDVADEKRAETCLNDAFDAVIRFVIQLLYRIRVHYFVAGRTFHYVVRYNVQYTVFQCRLPHFRPTLSSASGASLRVSVAGLDYMNDDPTAVDVLYANCTELTPTGEPAALPSRSAFPSLVAY